MISSKRVFRRKRLTSQVFLCNRLETTVEHMKPALKGSGPDWKWILDDN